MRNRIIVIFALAAIRLFPQSSEANIRSYFEQGEQALAAGQLQTAEACYLKLTTLAPTVAEVYGRLGLVYFEEKRFENAVPALRKALKLKPGLPNTDILLAMSLSETGRFPEALAGLEKGFHHSNDSALKRMCGLQLERAYTELRRDSDAVQVALELTRLYPKDPEVLYHSGRLFGNYAFLSMQTLAEVAPDSIWRHEAAADAYQSAGDYDLAAAEYRKVLEQSPDRPGIHYRLGRALLSNATHGSSTTTAADAAHEFEQELKLDPSNSNAAYELAEISRKGGELESARDLFTLALKYSPNFEEANVGLGRSLVALHAPEKAIPYLKRASELDPQDSVAYYQLGLAFKAVGNSGERRKALDKLEQLKSNTSAPSDLLKPETAVTKQPMQ